MKTPTVIAFRRAHVAHAWQLCSALLVFSLVPASKNFAQDEKEVVVQNSLRGRFISAKLGGAFSPGSDAEFKTEPTAPEVASGNMAGRPAEALPCEEHARTNESDSIPAAVHAAPKTPVARAEQNELDGAFLADKIQAVQRMIKLMELKEEIILEKARFQKELLDLQQKIKRQ